MSTHPITVHPARSFKANSHDVVNDPHLRKSFRGAMDFLMAKRGAVSRSQRAGSAAQPGEIVRQRCSAKLPQLLENCAQLTANGVKCTGRTGKANAIIHGSIAARKRQAGGQGVDGRRN